MEIDFSYTWANVTNLFVIIGVIFTVFIFLVKTRKDNNTRWETIEDQGNNNAESIKQIRQQMEKHEANVKDMFLEHKLDAKDDTNSLKLLTDRVSTLTEKVTESEKIHTELKTAIRDLAIEIKALVTDQRNFMADWNQRIEDRIETLRQEFISK